MERVRVMLLKVLAEIPATQRELARASGLTHGALGQARDGLSGLRPATVRRIVATLRLWSGTCARLADDLEQALEDDLSEEGGG
ncbi:hypothetical protein ACFL5T_02670 [Gemmatimonadota bacterium]